MTSQNTAIVFDVPPLISIADAAAALRVHPKTLDREVKRGRLKIVRVGVQRFVTEEIIKEYLAPR
jgi:excisionase family DNA binding protein